jgi:hypothetical protein
LIKQFHDKISPDVNVKYIDHELTRKFVALIKQLFPMFTELSEKEKTEFMDVIIMYQ